jgi:DNA modification methylase
LPNLRTERIGLATLYLGDCLTVLPTLSTVDVVVTDPPYGIEYESNQENALPGIAGDADLSLRNAVVEWLSGKPALLFGTWRKERPTGTRAVLIWAKGDHVGMGDLSLPWRPNWEEIYVLGDGFSGHRGSSVLRVNAPVSWNSVGFGRAHPHEKPVPLMKELISKCPGSVVCDPFMGSGTTGVATVQLGRKFIGVEIEPRYFDIACERIDNAQRQEALFA